MLDPFAKCDDPSHESVLYEARRGWRIRRSDCADCVRDRRIQRRLRFAAERPRMRRVMAHPVTEAELEVEMLARDMQRVASMMALPRPPRGPWMARKQEDGYGTTR